jgi:sugar phosphate permease
MSSATLLRVFCPFALGYFLSYLYRTVNAIIAPDLVRDVGLDPGSLGLLTSAYFLSFAAFQLPLGVLLDRFGPRRVEAALLLVAALGALVFARAESLTGLMIGRALIGLGVSACLMAAFKAFVIWFPTDRLPLANGIQMISGGIGAMAATTPVEAALHVTDWRGVFLAVSALTLVAAIVVFMVVPEQEQERSGETLREQMAGVGTILASPVFWKIAPWAILAQAAYLSLISLWSGPWLRDIVGLGRMDVANTLMMIAASTIVGYLTFGTLAERLAKRGIPPMRVAACGMALFLGVQLLLTLQWVSAAVPVWLLFGFFGTSCILPYAVLSQSFPRHLAGRANTGLNLFVFVAAFVAQWAIGVIIGFWPELASGAYHPNGYRAGFGMLVVLQIAAAGWYFKAGTVPSQDSVFSAVE